MRAQAKRGKSPDKQDRVRHFFETTRGSIFLGDSVRVLGQNVSEASVDLIMTSPPFGLVRKKEYGNEDAEDYVDWFRPFARQFHRVLKDSGSLVIDIGGSWVSGQPTRSLYHFELLLMLCKEFGFHLAQEVFWWNPSKLPSPAEWVTVRRIRLKDAINCVWWLSKTPWPKASNRRVPWPYSDAMRGLLKNGYRAKLRPSGHDISEKFAVDNGVAIAPNLIAVANTESNSAYLRACEASGIRPHPARYPAELPEFFTRMLTDPGDLVVDPFAGSCVTGEVAERLGRRWLCIDTIQEYLEGGLFRFDKVVDEPRSKGEYAFYRAYHPAAAWNGSEAPLQPDGGLTRTLQRRRKHIP